MCFFLSALKWIKLTTGVIWLDWVVLGRFWSWKHLDPPEEDECLAQRGAENKSNCQTKQFSASLSKLGGPWSCHTFWSITCVMPSGPSFQPWSWGCFHWFCQHGCEVTADDLQGHSSSAPCASLLQVAFLIFFLFITPLNNFSWEHRCLPCPLMMCPNGEINGIKHSRNGM